MRTLLRLVFLFVLALIVFVPALPAVAADGTGQEVASELADWVVVVGYGALILLLLALVVMGLLSLTEFRQWLKRRLIKLDSSPVWNTVGGRFINDSLRQFQPLVDESTDPLIQRLEATKYLRWLHKNGVIKGEDFSRILGALVADGVKLTNGVPDVEFNLLNYDSTQGGPLTGNFAPKG